MTDARKTIVTFLSLLIAVGALVALIWWPSDARDAAEGVARLARAVPEERGERPPPTPTPPPDEARARVYLVLDDGGHDIDQMRAFTPFRGTVTVAILPHLRDSARVARMVTALGHEIILHQPMEALGGNDPGPGAIMVADTEAEIRATLTANISSLPGIVGVNNHMGSRATEDERVVRVVLDTVGRYRLFFLDSKTTPRSVVPALASTGGAVVMRRDVFLDNVRDYEAISAQLDVALEIADERGWVVAIGHVTAQPLARVLIERHDELTAAGYRFLPLSDLARRMDGE